MSAAIQAIPTTYNWIKFRSRTEARWAVFFDLIGINYQYEPDKYFTGISRYIPDFILTLPGSDTRVWFEAKGPRASMAEMSKLANIAQAVPAFIASGSLTDRDLHQVWLEDTEVRYARAGFWACSFCSATIPAVMDGNEHRVIPPNHDCVEISWFAHCADISTDYIRGEHDWVSPKFQESELALIALEVAQNVQFEDRNIHEVVAKQQLIFSRLLQAGYGGMPSGCALIVYMHMLMDRNKGLTGVCDRTACLARLQKGRGATA